MSRAGFVLAGGSSSRMGNDKALLLMGNATLLARTARIVGGVCGQVAIIGPPERYPGVPHEIVADVHPGRGPLAGVETALGLRRGEYNLIVACDMPDLSSVLLERLMAFAETSRADCTMPRLPDGSLEPLCSVWRARALAKVEQALESGVRKMTDAMKGLEVVHFPLDDAAAVTNLNTPDEWRSYRLRHPASTEV